MSTNRLMANACSLSKNHGAGYLTTGSESFYRMRKYKANFIIKKDDDGILSAADLEQGIFADGKTMEELMSDIREAVECHFDVLPENVYNEVKINITEII